MVAVCDLYLIEGHRCALLAKRHPDVRVPPYSDDACPEEYSFDLSILPLGSTVKTKTKPQDGTDSDCDHHTREMCALL